MTIFILILPLKYGLTLLFCASQTSVALFLVVKFLKISKIVKEKQTQVRKCLFSFFTH